MISMLGLNFYSYVSVGLLHLVRPLRTKLQPLSMLRAKLNLACLAIVCIVLDLC